MEIEENGIRYLIEEDKLIATVIRSPEAKGTVFIPRYVKSKNKNYKVISIGNEVFENLNLESLEFPQDSEIKSFGSVLYSTDIKKLQIPASLEEIDENCFFLTNNLVDIEVSPDNEHFSYIEDKFLVGKSDTNLKSFDTLIFARTDLKEVVIPPNIKFLKKCSLVKCDELKTIIFPEDSKVEKIGKDVLSWNFNKLVLSKSIKSISNDAFEYCNYIKEIEISSQNQFFTVIDKIFILVKNEETKQFDKLIYIASQQEEVTIPRSVRQINNYAISYRSLKRLNFTKDSKLEIIKANKLHSLEKLTIPKNLKEIDPHCFFGAKCIKEIEVSPENEFFTLLNNKYLMKKSEGSQFFDIFYLCPRNIEKVTIPHYVKIISQFAISFCGALNSISFESNSSIETFYDYSIAYCSRLTNIVIPKSVKKIGKGISCLDNLQFIQILGEEIYIGIWSFYECKKIETISFPNVKKLIYYGYVYDNMKIQVPKEAKFSIDDKYKDHIEFIDKGSISETQFNDQIESLKKENDELKKSQEKQAKQMKSQETTNQKQKKQIEEQKIQIESQKDEINELKKQLQKLKDQIKELPTTTVTPPNQPFNDLKILEREAVQEFRPMKVIGRGQAGEVSKVGIEKIYAVKYMNTEDEDFDIERFKRFMAEYEILNMLNHPNIIKVFGFYNGDETNKPLILMEFCSSSLDKLIKSKELSNYDKVIIIYQIVEGFKYVHYKGIIHRDIKPKNILITDDKIIKICDFGISKVVSPDETTVTTGIGTQKFMAPEMINEQKNYTEKIDVYSFGVLLFLIICEKLPDITVPAIASGKMAEIPSKVNDFTRDLIEKCWSFNPEERPSFELISNMIKDAKYELVDLNEYEKKEVASFVRNHNQKIPKYDQPHAPTLTEIRRNKAPRPSIIQPNPLKQPKIHKK